MLLSMQYLLQRVAELKKLQIIHIIEIIYRNNNN